MLHRLWMFDPENTCQCAKAEVMCELKNQSGWAYLTHLERFPSIQINVMAAGFEVKCAICHYCSTALQPAVRRHYTMIFHEGFLTRVIPHLNFGSHLGRPHWPFAEHK